MGQTIDGSAILFIHLAMCVQRNNGIYTLVYSSTDKKLNQKVE